MKTVNILADLPATLRTQVLRHADKYQAARAIAQEIGHTSGALLHFADERKIDWRGRLWRFCELSPEQRIKNLGERLVVAARIEASRTRTRATAGKLQPRRATRRSPVAA
jgi:hypothetical protein